MAPKLSIAEILEKHRGEKHLVILHDYPDPDAISSAFAHRLISEEYDIAVDILYSGKISHGQNVALVKLLGIDLIPYKIGLDLKQYQGAVFIDHQGTSANGIIKALEAAEVPVLIVVDHHELQEGVKAAFIDIQKTGSTATIYARYLKQGLLEIQKGLKEHIAMATALMHGILTDTGGFIQADQEDFQSAAFLSQFSDPKLLEQIMNQARSKQVMDVIRRALENRTVVENNSIAGIGYLRSEDRDAIPQAADFLVNEENVHTAIVYGIVRDESQAEVLTGSLRTSKLIFDPDEFIKEVFGVSPDGRYYGGGKHMAGGFNIPIEFLAGEPNEEYAGLKWQVFDTQVKAKIFNRIGVKHDPHREQQK
jgi:nanoRNase/pAp phosphatase (c-di-AMP/oligoRNAs hydrolase)